MTGIPSSEMTLAVPPVERISTPSSWSRLTKGISPSFYETEISALSIFICNIGDLQIPKKIA